MLWSQLWRVPPLHVHCFMSTRPQHAGSMLHCVRQACCVSQSMQQYGASGGVGKQEPVVSVQCISSRTMLHILYNYSSRCCKSSTACLPVVCNPQTHGPDSAAHNCIGMLHNTGDFNTLGAVGHNVDDAIWEHQAAAIGLSGRLRVSVQQMHLNTLTCLDLLDNMSACRWSFQSHLIRIKYSISYIHPCNSSSHKKRPAYNLWKNYRQ